MSDPNRPDSPIPSPDSPTSPDRRAILEGAAGTLLAFLAGCKTPKAVSMGLGGIEPAIGFEPVPISAADAVVLPAGYRYHVVNAWGDPVVAGAPAFSPDVHQSAAVQALQAGMHHDGMAFFPLPRGSAASDHGLLAINFEYTDDNLLSPGGTTPLTAEKVQKSKNAHGLGIIEVRNDSGTWRSVANSRYGRRVTADTPITLVGPAAGHGSLRTAADPEGRRVRGTFNNCAQGRTPWGTYLACEENFAPYFVDDSDNKTRLSERYGIPTSKESWGYRWHEFDERFDAGRHPNEPNRFGWVVEIDPHAPDSQPVKRTALGRLAHEGATVTLAPDNRVVVYMGDDDFRSKFEHIYKFVSARPFRPDDPGANRDLLDEGTLYAARFDADGRGTWLPLVQGQAPLTESNGFASQADVLIGARLAADAVGATYMDRPEWIAIHPRTREVFCSLTNNSARGKGKPALATAPLGPDAVNRRAPNTMGHIVRWREARDDAAATTFTWQIFLEAGDPAHEDIQKRGNVAAGVAFAQPDGLCFDPRGLLWISTDSSAQNMASPDWKRIGNNQILAADPNTGEVRRFLTGPVSAELTGLLFTPDGRTMFVNVQHPGESPASFPARNDPNNPKAWSSWPDGAAGSRPRSATIAIRRDDGGVIGT